jgi:aldehyde:ferredoxin oxidoreductase
MDTMSTGSNLAFAMECYEHGFMSDAQLGESSLEWGDHAAMVRVVERIACGDGAVADILGDGTAKAVERLGPETAQFAMACGGEELGMHDPRCFPGIATSYIADATPGRHTQAGAWFVESLFCPPDYQPPGGQLDRDDYAARGEAHKWISDFHHALSQAGLCQFSLALVPSSVLPTYLTLATGRDFTMDTVLEAGERVANLRIAFNLREGLRNKETYHLPPRVLGEPPLAGGGTKGVTILDNEQQLGGYYSAMGWNPETGVPMRQTLERLGLGFASDVAE